MVRGDREAAKKYGARIYQLDDGVIVVKQTVKRGEGHAARYVIDDDRERHVDPGQDALLARAVRDALAGELEHPKNLVDLTSSTSAPMRKAHTVTPKARGLRLSDLPALFASLPRLSEEEAVRFERDLEEARAERARHPAEDRWAS